MSPYPPGGETKNCLFLPVSPKNFPSLPGRDMPHPSLSTDQVAAFVEVARQGSLRAAAAGLFLTEQGVRNRLLALERQLGVELYRKRRGPRQGGVLTAAGREFFPHAAAFLERAGQLARRRRGKATSRRRST